jgi:ABC-type bacteriocin/lantibiotic exporter with double-glycine peptidase domain
MVAMALGHLVESRHNRSFHLPESPPVHQKESFSQVSAALTYAYHVLGLEISEDTILSQMNLYTEGAGWLDMIDNAIQNGVNFTFYRHRKYRTLLNIQLENQNPTLVIWKSIRNSNDPHRNISVIKEIDIHSILLMDPVYGDFYRMSARDFDKAWMDYENQSSFLMLSI